MTPRIKHANLEHERTVFRVKWRPSLELSGLEFALNQAILYRSTRIE
jgi:hypothetical protein